MQLTPEELTKFRTELADYPDSIAALDVIENDCDGYIEDAIALMLDEDENRSPRDVLDQCRQFLCQEEIRNALESEFITRAIELISIKIGVPHFIATLIAIWAFQLGIKKVCAN